MDAISGAGANAVAQTLQSRQEFATSTIKDQAEADQLIAEAIDEAAEGAEVQANGKTRGQIVDISV